jgi:hypothetical protein
MQLVITHEVMVGTQNQFLRKGVSIAHADKDKNILRAHQRTNITIC